MALYIKRYPKRIISARRALRLQLRGIVLLLCMLHAGVECAGQSFNSWEAAAGPYGGAVVGISVNRTDQGDLMVATRGGGCFRSNDGGGTWLEASVGLASPRMLCITPRSAVRPDVFVALEPPGGIWRSTDNGRSWSKSSSGLPANALVTDITYSTESAQIMFAASSAGLFRSTDGGTNWTIISPEGVRAVLTLPASRVLAGTAAGDILLSTDGGNSFTIVSSTAGTVVNNFGHDPQSPPVIYAATTRGIRKSSDAGASWSLLSALGNSVVRAIAARAPATVYAATGGAGIQRSTNGGVSWMQVNTGLTSATINDIVFAVGANAELYAATEDGEGVYRSSDGGDSWSPNNSGVRAAAITACASTINAVFVAAAGKGILKSTDNGDSWAGAGSGLERTVIVTALAADPSNPGTLYAGTTDGVYKTLTAGSGDGAWMRRMNGVAAGVATAIAVDPVRTQNVFASFLSDGLYRSTNAGDSWTALRSGLPATASIPAIALSRTDPTVMYIAVNAPDTQDDGIYISTNSGADWSFRGALSTQGEIRSLAVDGSALYAGATDGLYISSNSGVSWTRASGATEGKAVRSIAIHAGTSAYIFAGTSSGTYRSTNSGQDWLAFPAGPFDLSVDQLHFDARNETTLYAATIGSGLYRCNLAPVISGDDSLVFPDVPVGSSLEKSVLLRNAGLLPLDVNNVRLLGPHASQFRIPGSTSGIVVAVDAELQIPVLFTPTAEGEKTASMQLSTNAPEASSYIIEVRGRSSAARLLVSVSSLDFGEIVVGASRDSVIQVTNSGSAPFHLARQYITGDDSSHFSIAAGLPSVLLPNETASVTSRFAPTATGDKKAEFRIEGDGANAPGVSVSLSGNGRNELELRVEPLAIDFGAISVNTTRDTAVIIRNVGSAAISMIGQDIEGADQDEYIILQRAPDIMPPGSSADMQLRFRPLSDGAKSAALRIRSTAANSPDVVVPLSGTAGSAAAISITPSSLDFGEQDLGSSTQFSVDVTNSGSAGLEINSIRVDGATAFTAGTLSSPLAPGETKMLQVTFRPLTSGTHTADLIVESDAVNTPMLTVPLRGATKGRPLITTGISTLSFGVVAYGSSSVLGFRIANAGTALLSISVQDISGTHETDFFIEKSSKTELDPGQEDSIRIRFTPSANGPRSAKLSIVSNDGDPSRDTLSIVLEGEGVRDETAPVITHQSPATVLTPGEDLLIQAEAEDLESGVQRIELWYRSGAQPWAEDRRIELTGPEATIPAAYVTSEGLDYRLIAVDNAGNQDTARNGLHTFYSVPVAVEEGSAGGFSTPEGSTASAYRIVSFPFDLEDGAFASVFAPLGIYNPRLWRLFTYRDGAVRELQDVMSTSERALAGRGYFLITRSSAFITNAAGTTIRTTDGMAAGSAAIPGWELSPGWNLVGNPYGFDIGRSSLRLENGDALNDLWTLDGSWRIADTLKAFGGAAIYVASATRLLLTENAQGGFNFAPPVTSLASKREASHPDAWTLRLRVNSDQGVDEENYIGVHPEALDAVDKMDRHEPPQIPGGISLAFEPASGDCRTSLATDMKPTGNEMYEWIGVAAAEPGGICTLSIEGREVLPAGYAIICLDDEAGIPYDMNICSYLKFHTGKGSKRFTILVGKKEQVDARLRNSVKNRLPENPLVVYPTPASGDFVMRCEIDAPGHAVLTVRDIVGRTVLWLADQVINAGKHEWYVSAGHLPVGWYHAWITIQAADGTMRSFSARIALH